MYNPITGIQQLWNWDAASKTLGVFAEDTWRANKNLTLALGMTEMKRSVRFHARSSYRRIKIQRYKVQRKLNMTRVMLLPFPFSSTLSDFILKI